MIGWILGLLGFATYPRREYDVYAILGDPARSPIWRWDRWTNEVVPLLDPLISAARGKPGVKSIQHKNVSPKSSDFLRFGRLGWNNASHAKWVHGSPENSDKCDAWRLVETVVHAPHINQCARDDVPPDVYFELASFDQQNLISPLLVLALATELPDPVLQSGREAALGLAELTGASIVAYRRRPWGIPNGRMIVSHDDTIDHMRLLKHQWYNRPCVTSDVLEADWTNLLAASTR